MLLPALRRQSRVVRKGVCAATGLSATDTAKRFEFEYATTDAEQIVNDPAINTIFIATRHDLHARLTLAALRNGKAVFVEKPLAIREEELASLESMVREQACSLMVGYNRRFAPQVLHLARWMHAQPDPWIATYRINAGALPINHWYYDREQGGGRLIGEVCHFVDLLAFLFASSPTAVQTAVASVGRSRSAEENTVYTVHFWSGSVGQIIYSAGGDPSVAKERLEVIGNGSVATLDNFRHLWIVQNHKKRSWRSLVPDKGHRSCLQSFLDAVCAGSEMPISQSDLFRISHVCFELSRSLQQHS
jgi:predicted dehydrogenase